MRDRRVWYGIQNAARRHGPTGASCPDQLRLAGDSTPSPSSTHDSAGSSIVSCRTSCENRSSQRHSTQHALHASRSGRRPSPTKPIGFPEAIQAATLRNAALTILGLAGVTEIRAHDPHLPVGETPSHHSISRTLSQPWPQPVASFPRARRLWFHSDSSFSTPMACDLGASPCWVPRQLLADARERHFLAVSASRVDA